MEQFNLDEFKRSCKLAGLARLLLSHCSMGDIGERSVILTCEPEHARLASNKVAFSYLQDALTEYLNKPVKLEICGAMKQNKADKLVDL